MEVNLYTVTFRAKCVLIRVYIVLIVHRGDTISLYGKTGKSQGSLLEGMWKMNWVDCDIHAWVL